MPISDSHRTNASQEHRRTWPRSQSSHLTWRWQSVEWIDTFLVMLDGELKMFPVVVGTCITFTSRLLGRSTTLQSGMKTSCNELKAPHYPPSSTYVLLSRFFCWLLPQGMYLLTTVLTMAMYRMMVRCFKRLDYYYGSFYDGVSNDVYQISIQMPKHVVAMAGCEEEEAGLCWEEQAFPVRQPNKMRLRTRSEKLKSCFDQFLCISTVINMVTAGELWTDGDNGGSPLYYAFVNGV